MPLSKEEECLIDSIPLSTEDKNIIAECVIETLNDSQSFLEIELELLYPEYEELKSHLEDVIWDMSRINHRNQSLYDTEWGYQFGLISEEIDVIEKEISLFKNTISSLNELYVKLKPQILKNKNEKSFEKCMNLIEKLYPNRINLYMVQMSEMNGYR